MHINGARRGHLQSPNKTVSLKVHDASDRKDEETITTPCPSLFHKRRSSTEAISGKVLTRRKNNHKKLQIWKDPYSYWDPNKMWTPNESVISDMFSPFLHAEKQDVDIYKKYNTESVAYLFTLPSWEKKTNFSS